VTAVALAFRCVLVGEVGEAGVEEVRVRHARARALQDYDDERILGWAVGYALVYLYDEVEPGSPLERYLCGTTEPGYHMMFGEPAPGDVVSHCEEFGPSSLEGGARLEPVSRDVIMDIAYESGWSAPGR
jgi:hypothetical protein